ncbi:cardiolipin synthase ClsB [Achromobacter aloeverae]|uniref:Cardiolipin synthase B n=1 Tax=Achromobacter aloeverae TaxID=1750518 RepID=A0A4Q1HH40_9BURK|nr:cardiolipin synthase ClsB [Achromobacter aloeverae]RXN86766.1 cardiolipin synthase ClsB [Achromobacter aloeverae]
MTARALRLDWTEGNAIRLLMNGADFFPALCEAIDDARHSVHLETYIFTLDRTGRQVLEALERAAARGVQVRVVVDGFGSLETGEAVAARIKAAGGDCRIFRPEPHWIKRLLFSRSRLRRLHRKVAVVDAEVAFIGGINIEDDYDDVALTEEIAANPRFDFAVEVRGPLVSYAVHAQDLLWVRLNWASVRRDPRKWRRPTQWRRLKRPANAPAQPPAGPLRAALVLRDNLRFRNTFERAYLYGIARARHEILIASAYFFPGVRFRKALARAAARGVRVRLVLQGKIEYRMQYYATHALYEELLRAGIEIYEYMPSFLHAKVAVIDHMATVGSSNLDPFSLLLAREANVVVDDAGFSDELHKRLEAEIARGGRLVRSVEYARRGWLRRCVDTVSYTLLRLGVALTGQTGRY